MATQADGVTPVAYDPCRPVHYVMRPDNAPAGAEALLSKAFRRVSAATGLQFVYDGRTDEAPSQQRELYQPERYGDRWAPVLVTWATRQEQPDFAGTTVGQAGSRPYAVTGSPMVYVTGMVELDAAGFRERLVRDRDAKAPLTVLLHELGHLVGLDHVVDERQVMHPAGQLQSGAYGSGDRAGLAQLGQGACVPAV